MAATVHPLYLPAAGEVQLLIRPSFIPGHIEFRFGACVGCLKVGETSYDLLAVANEAPGNGDFSRLLDHLQALGQAHARDVVILEIHNRPLHGHLLKCRGFDGVPGTWHALLAVGGPGTCPEEYLHQEPNELLDELLDFITSMVVPPRKAA